MHALAIVLTAVLSFGLAAPVAAQIPGPVSITKDAVTPQSIERRIATRAVEIQKMAPSAARFPVFDLAWPLTADEYRALGRHAVLFVAAISQEAEELPPRRVYIKAKDRTIELERLSLERLSSVRRNVPAGTLPHTVFGPYREDSFYLVPIGSYIQEWLLVTDFAKNRNEFTVTRGPLGPPDFIYADRNRSAVARPDAATLKDVLAREYPGFKQGR